MLQRVPDEWLLAGFRKVGPMDGCWIGFRRGQLRVPDWVPGGTKRLLQRVAMSFGEVPERFWVPRGSGAVTSGSETLEAKFLVVAGECVFF